MLFKRIVLYFATCKLNKIIGRTVEIGAATTRLFSLFAISNKMVLPKNQFKSFKMNVTKAYLRPYHKRKLELNSKNVELK